MNREIRFEIMKLLMNLEMTSVVKKQYEDLFRGIVQQDERMKEFFYNLSYYLSPDEED
jgi:hypothetical protein